MRLTVGIPAYNAEGALGEVLRAVLDQVRSGDNVLVLDDGSTDETAVIAENAGVACLRHAANRGLAEGRNTLLSHAGTELIVYLDADAVPAPGAIERLRDGFVSDDVAGVGGRGVELDRSNRAARWRAAHCPQDHGRLALDSDWMLMGLCCAFRTDALREIGGFDPDFKSYGEDADASLRLRARGYRLRYLPDAVVHHRREDGFRGVVKQAYGHTYHLCRALRKNGERELLREYRAGTMRHLFRVTARSLKRGRFLDAGIGLSCLVARGIAIWRARLFL